MSNRVGLVLCILCGSFFVYCGQTMMTGVSHGRRDGGIGGGGGDGPIGDAMAQSSGGGGTCCSPPARESPTVLFDDVVKPTVVGGTAGTPACTMLTPVFDVSGYRTIIVHAQSCQYWVQFRNGKAGFVSGAKSLCDADSNTVNFALSVNAINGHDMRVNFGSPSYTQPDGTANCDIQPTAVTIVAYKDQ